MKVLILGLGYTGNRLGQLLIQSGNEVIGTRRTTSNPFPNRISVLQYDFNSAAGSPSDFWQSCGPCSHILSTIAPTPDGRDPGWEVLKHYPNPQDLKWVGYLSTTGVYGNTHGAWVDELSPVQPSNARSQSRVKIEQQWLESALPTHIFRLPGIYGPSRSIFERIHSGNIQNIIKPGHVFSRIHVDDIAQTLLRSMQNPTPGEIYNVADDEPSEPRDLLIMGLKLLNREIPPPIPFEDAQLSPMGLSFWQDCRRVSNQKIKDKLGIQLLYPSYREGLQAIYNQL